jgi:SAM-dependent methyltransferase
LEDHTSRPSVSPEVYTEDYFLAACEGYAEWLDTEGEQLSRRLAASFELAAVEPGMCVLDVGCGRGEIVRHCAHLGADAYGIDYARSALALAARLLADLESEHHPPGKAGLMQADAKRLPFPDSTFDRVLMFDVIEHLYPWEADHALAEVHRVLKPDGRLIVHTAPNRWYNRYAYPLVRLVRTLMGEGDKYPRDPRLFGVAFNRDVHVNEQDPSSLRRTLQRAGFRGQVWLDSPPQNRDEGWLLAALRRMAFEWVPFRWFFEREVFAVTRKVAK